MGIRRIVLGAVLAAVAGPVVAAVPATVPAHTSSTGMATDLGGHVPHLAHPATGVYTGGQPGAGAWDVLRKAGVTTVINLRSDREMLGSGEARGVRAAGMRYVHIPVAGGDDVDRAHAARLRAAIDAAGGKVLVHCASGNRAGALLAIDAADHGGLDVDAAVAYGKSAGLSGLEPRVREVLAIPAVPRTMAECTAEHLRADVAPTHMRKPWPRIDALPKAFEGEDGIRISDEQRVADGYRYTLYVDTAKRQAYVVQQGGIAGVRNVFGPLPVTPCGTTSAASAASAR